MISVADQRTLWLKIRAYAKATGDAMVASPVTAQPGWKAKGREFDKASAELSSFIQSLTITEKRT
jgi:hypothetical protein